MTNETSPTIFNLTATEEDIHLRLDSFITKKIPAYSRSFFKKLFTDNLITVNGTVVTKPSQELRSGDVVTVQLPPLPPLGTPKKFEGDLGVRILFEHPDFLIVYKPAGLITHAPHATSLEVTLVDWLLTAFADLSSVGEADRPGVVHRLDKDTSGLLIIPRNNQALAAFSDLFKERKIHKTYLALATGHPAPEGTINLPIARHPNLKYKMTHLNEKMAQQWNIKGRPAVTHYKVLEQFKDCALVEVKPVTGRTHQIRVHFAALGHPLLGDAIYGKASPLIGRQALHAQALSFEYQGKQYDFSAELPEDFVQAINQLRHR
jgi:23S rRNA pseudouridine1911/1915/1917 synthase